MEATCSSDTSVDFQRTTLRHIPEERTLHNNRCKNLKSNIYSYYSVKDLCVSLSLNTETACNIKVTFRRREKQLLLIRVHRTSPNENICTNKHSSVFKYSNRSVSLGGILCGDHVSEDLSFFPSLDPSLTHYQSHRTKTPWQPIKCH
jgi:hypothetical protein